MHERVNEIKEIIALLKKFEGSKVIVYNLHSHPTAPTKIINLQTLYKDEVLRLRNKSKTQNVGINIKNVQSAHYINLPLLCTGEIITLAEHFAFILDKN